MAVKQVNGEVLGVDGITFNAVNIAVRVGAEEIDRIAANPRFRIDTIVKLSNK
jgi:hypothetical protein